MQVLLDLLGELFGDALGKPKLSYDPVQVMDKKTRRWLVRQLK
jgi:hypothetical protein